MNYKYKEKKLTEKSFQRVSAKYYRLFPGNFYHKILLSLSDVSLNSKGLLTGISTNSTFKTVIKSSK